jgi:hypothetical protein
MCIGLPVTMNPVDDNDCRFARPEADVERDLLTRVGKSGRTNWIKGKTLRTGQLLSPLKNVWKSVDFV